MSFSFASRIARGGSRRDLWVHVARRALIIYGLGLFMAGYPGFDFATVRLVGVLARPRSTGSSTSAAGAAGPSRWSSTA